MSKGPLRSCEDPLDIHTNNDHDKACGVTTRDEPAVPRLESNTSPTPSRLGIAEGNLKALEHFSVDPEMERKILRKQDLSIGPVIMLLYFFSFLDRSNIGNAGTAGLQQDLGLHGRQFNVATSIFYVTYVLVETPAAILFRKFGADKMIPVIALAWGLTTLFSGFMSSFAGLISTRLILGACEGGLFPSLNLILVNYYKREEMAKRTSFIFGAAAISSAVGGLLAYGILKMDGVSGLAGWRWLYILEGLVSTLFAILTFFILPDQPSHAYFLTTEEKKIAQLRIEQAVVFQGAGPFEWSEFRRALKDGKVWLSTFLPTILAGFGYDTLKRQYMTIPVYAWGAIVYFTVAWLSDRTQMRALPLIITTCFTIAGYAILVSVRNNAVLYLSAFLVVTGVYTAPGLNVTWLNINQAGQWKRSTALGFQQTLANTAGIVAGQLYVSTNGPYYLTGQAVSLAFITVTTLGFVAMWFLLRAENNKRDAILFGDRDDPFKLKGRERKGDEDLHFRFSL